MNPVFKLFAVTYKSGSEAATQADRNEPKTLILPNDDPNHAREAAQKILGQADHISAVQECSSVWGNEKDLHINRTSVAA